jgi:hypothetical protein
MNELSEYSIETKAVQNVLVNDSVLIAENLSGGYGKDSTTAIWRDANFTINKGEFIAVLGAVAWPFKTCRWIIEGVKCCTTAREFSYRVCTATP